MYRKIIAGLAGLMLAFTASAQEIELGTAPGSTMIHTNTPAAIALAVSTLAGQIAETYQPLGVYLTAESDPVWAGVSNVVTSGAALGTTSVQPAALAAYLPLTGGIVSGALAVQGILSTTNAVTIGTRGEGAVGVASLASGYNVVASGEASTASGGDTTASGEASTASGVGTTASGFYSAASGYYTTASGEASTASGGDTTASGVASAASGGGTTASGDYSAASGVGTIASGYASTASGGDTTASGDYSTASGYYTTASHVGSFAWQGTAGTFDEPTYTSRGAGTFAVNPIGGLTGFYIGETSMAALLGAKVGTNHTGNVAIDGDLTATAFVGSGADLTGVTKPADLAAALDTYRAWTATITPASGTSTVTRAAGTHPVLTLAAPTVLAFDPTGYSETGGVHRVTLTLWSGTNSVTFATNNVTWTSTPTTSTNDYTSILIRKTGASRARGTVLP